MPIYTHERRTLTVHGARNARNARQPPKHQFVHGDRLNQAL